MYSICTKNEFPPSSLIENAKQIAFQRLPQPAITDDRYGIAFLIVHQGDQGNWLLIDWWVNEDILQHHVYHSPLAAAERFEYVSPTGVMACVWELAVYGFERQAWIENVLANPNGPNLTAYLAQHLNDDV